MEGEYPRSRDGTLLCAAQRPGVSHPLATNDLIGINLSVMECALHPFPVHCGLSRVTLPRPCHRSIGSSPRTSSPTSVS